MNKNLLILGRGQYSFIVEEIARDIDEFENVDFLDDSSDEAIGKIEEYSRLISNYSYAIVSIGNPVVRLNLTEKLKEAGYVIPTLISSRAHISSTAQIGVGCIIEPMAVVNPNTIIEKCCIISAGAVVNHNSLVKMGCHIDCNATVMSNSVVEEKTKLLCGETYKN